MGPLNANFNFAKNVPLRFPVEHVSEKMHVKRAPKHLYFKLKLSQGIKILYCSWYLC